MLCAGKTLRSLRLVGGASRLIRPGARTAPYVTATGLASHPPQQGHFIRTIHRTGVGLPVLALPRIPLIRLLSVTGGEKWTQNRWFEKGPLFLSEGHEKGRWISPPALECVMFCRVRIPIKSDTDSDLIRTGFRSTSDSVPEFAGQFLGAKRRSGSSTTL